MSGNAGAVPSASTPVGTPGSAASSTPPPQPEPVASGQANAATQAAAAPGDLDPNRRVCRRQEVLGSRLRARQVCRTAAQWDAMDARARANAKDMTDTPNAAGTGARMGGG
jgi:hypothetical protein